MAETFEEYTDIEPLIDEDGSEYDLIETEGDITDDDIAQKILAFRDESEEARRTREDFNRRNIAAYHNRDCVTQKIDGQSNEFLPKTQVAVDTLAAYIEQGITGYGDWFQVSLEPNPYITQTPMKAHLVQKLMRYHLEHPPRGLLPFSTIISDAVKYALLQSLLVLKVHGKFVTERVPNIDFSLIRETSEQEITYRQESDLNLIERTVWHPLVEVIRPEDYFPDPSGSGLYEIHRFEKDYYELIDQAQGEHAIYNMEEVEKITSTSTHSERHTRMDDETNQDGAHNRVIGRKRIVCYEFWGTLLDEDGHVLAAPDGTLYKNIVCTITECGRLIRAPQVNPFWHQQSPFCVAPLSRVPGSVYHKAIFDSVVDLNIAQNNLYNLIFDAGVSSVWGTKQFAAHRVANAEEFQNGIPPGSVLVLTEDADPQIPVMTRIPDGNLPSDALNLFNLMEREADRASMVNSFKQGVLPPRQVKATEIQASENQSSVLMDNLLRTLEVHVIQPVLTKYWMNILQNSDMWGSLKTVAIIGEEATRFIAGIPPAMRFYLYAEGTHFKVDGLSSLQKNTQQFQKIMALLQGASTTPLLLQEFMQRISMPKMLDFMLKIMNINPEMFEATDEEKASLEQRMEQMKQIQQMMNPEQNPTNAFRAAQNTAPETGEESVAHSIANFTNPTSG